MIQTSLLIIILVVWCLWYTGRRASRVKGGKGEKLDSLMNPKVYASLLGFALVLAFLWH